MQLQINPASSSLHHRASQSECWSLFVSKHSSASVRLGQTSPHWSHLAHPSSLSTGPQGLQMGRISSVLCCGERIIHQRLLSGKVGVWSPSFSSFLRFSFFMRVLLERWFVSCIAVRHGFYSARRLKPPQSAAPDPGSKLRSLDEILHVQNRTGSGERKSNPCLEAWAELRRNGAEKHFERLDNMLGEWRGSQFIIIWSTSLHWHDLLWELRRKRIPPAEPPWKRRCSPRWKLPGSGVGPTEFLLTPDPREDPADPPLLSPGGVYCPHGTQRAATRRQAVGLQGC